MLMLRGAHKWGDKESQNRSGGTGKEEWVILFVGNMLLLHQCGNGES